MSVDTTDYTFREDSVFHIKHKFSIVFNYKCNPKNEFVLYMSSIGGLFSLWFGLSFVDISIKFKKYVNYCKIKLMSLIIIENLFRNLKRKLKFLKYIINVIKFFKIMLVKMDKYNFNKFIKFILMLLLIIQICQLLIIYFNYKTKTDYNLKIYKSPNNLISKDLLPSVTICYKLTLDNLIFKKHNVHELEYYYNTENFYKLNLINLTHRNSSSSKDIAMERVLTQLYFYYTKNNWGKGFKADDWRSSLDLKFISYKFMELMMTKNKSDYQDKLLEIYHLNQTTLNILINISHSSDMPMNLSI